MTTCGIPATWRAVFRVGTCDGVALTGSRRETGIRATLLPNFKRVPAVRLRIYYSFHYNGDAISA